MTESPLRMRIDADALAQNWNVLDRMSGTAECGAAVKADGYGLGARQVVSRLAAAGCRQFYVATWGEAAELHDLSVAVSVLHGVDASDLAEACTSRARPVLNSPRQVRRWIDAGGGPCDVMIDTGMNRLGLSPDDVATGLLDDLTIDTAMSHLACADENHPMNALQCSTFTALRHRVSARRYSLANSAGIALGPDYIFDLTRPGLALYGGIQRPEFVGQIRQTVTPEARVIQRRRVRSGQTVGYNATWRAPADTEVAIINLGYADGYFRAFSNRGAGLKNETCLPVIGRVSMDLTALDVSQAPQLCEGDWIAINFNLPAAASATGMSQYELLTSLGRRYDRLWSG